MPNSILLKNGTLLVHSDDGSVINPIVSDLLIRGNIIERITQNISAEGDTTVIDCTNKIISPGFVDTHRHMWHTQVKGFANSLLFDYIADGRQAFNYLRDTSNVLTLTLQRTLLRGLCTNPMMSFGDN